jgi:hypothetical protein
MGKKYRRKEIRCGGDKGKEERWRGIKKRKKLFPIEFQWTSYTT